MSLWIYGTILITATSVAVALVWRAFTASPAFQHSGTEVEVPVALTGVVQHVSEKEILLLDPASKQAIPLPLDESLEIRVVGKEGAFEVGSRASVRAGSVAIYRQTETGASLSIVPSEADAPEAAE